MMKWNESDIGLLLERLYSSFLDFVEIIDENPSLIMSDYEEKCSEETQNRILKELKGSVQEIL